jgi:hypothetical protein
LFGSDEEEKVENQLDDSSDSDRDNKKATSDAEDNDSDLNDTQMEKPKKQHEFNYDCPYPNIDTEESIFSVSDPMKTGHVSYSVIGEDNDGAFNVTRRYTDFHKLRTALVARWPGVYVPPIPPKQSVGNKKDKFVESRMYFLDQFIKKIGEIPYLVNSQEFKCFSKPTGDVGGTLAALAPMTPQLIKERLIGELYIPLEIEEMKFKESREAVNEFGAFIKKVMNTLKVIKEQAKKMISAKESTNNTTKAVVDVMSFYEANGLSKF